MNFLLVLLETTENDPTFWEKIGNLWDSITSGVVDIYNFLKSGVSSFFTFLDTITVALNLPAYLTGVIPDILYAMITAVIASSILKLIFTRGGSR